MMAAINIWNHLNLEPQHPNLLQELKKQADLLATKTNGVLYCEVNPLDAYNEQSQEVGVFYNFYIYAPYLGNIRRLLFTVVEDGEKLILLDKISNSPKIKVDTITDLMKDIEKIIATREVSELISNFYNSSLQTKSASPMPYLTKSKKR